jgi:hypothetical protein
VRFIFSSVKVSAIEKSDRSITKADENSSQPVCGLPKTASPFVGKGREVGSSLSPRQELSSDFLGQALRLPIRSKPA